MSDSERKPGFTVTDRRSISEEGETRSGPATNDPSPASAPEVAASAQDTSRPAATTGRELPPADFSTFLLSLGSSALIHLGDEGPPGQEVKRRDLPLAKHTIDLLSLLREKTRSNLSPEEDKLLDSLLYDLRLRYVEVAKGGS